MSKRKLDPEKESLLRAHASEYFETLGENTARNEKYIDAIHAATYDERFPQMYKVLPTNEFGKAQIRHFEVSISQSAMTKLRAKLNPDTRWYEYVAPGKYAALVIDGVLFMTDTGHERWSSFPLIDNAYGDVFISGLGLGMVLLPLLTNGHVQRIYVLEKEPDVVGLVGAPLFRYLCSQVGLDRQRDVRVLHGDVWTWKNPDKLKFSTIFHDIWATFGPDLLPEFAKLKKRYRKWLAKGTHWQGCWAEDTCKTLKEEFDRKAREVQAAVGGDPMQALEGEE